MGKEPEIILTGWRGWIAARLGIPPWGQILILALIVQGYFFLDMRSDLNKIQGSIQTMPIAIGEDLLSQAKDDASVNNISRATQAIRSAELLLVRSKAKGVRAKPDDFDNLVQDLNALGAASPKPEFSESIGNARLILANYRSALEPKSPMRGPQAEIKKQIDVNVEAETLDKSKLPGTVIMAPPGATFDFMGTPFIRRLANAPSIVDIRFMNGAQTLDGFRWDGVAFVDTLIRYDGGEVELKNTRFINCTFQMPNNPRAAKVATYVSLGQSYLKIGPGD